MSRATQEKSTPEPVIDGRPDPHMHSGKCTICRHSQRAEIERAFIDWTSPREIARAFGLAGHAAVYRHAHARGLFDHRRRNLLIGLGRIAEHVGEIEPSAANVLAAFIAMAKIDARGDWSTGSRFNIVEAHDRATWDVASTMERASVMAALLAGKDPFDEPDLFEKRMEDNEEDESDEPDPEAGAEVPQPEAPQPEAPQPPEEPVSDVAAGNSPAPPQSAYSADPAAQPAPPAQPSAPQPAAPASNPAASTPPQAAGPTSPWSPDNPITFNRLRPRPLLR